MTEWININKTKPPVSEDINVVDWFLVAILNGDEYTIRIVFPRERPTTRRARR